MAFFRGLLAMPSIIIMQAWMVVMMMMEDSSAMAANNWVNYRGSPYYSSSPNTTATFCHNKKNGLYSDPSSRDYFWVCWEGGLHGARLLCPPNTLWNQTSSKCSAAYATSSSNSAYAASSSYSTYNTSSFQSATSPLSAYNGSANYTSSAHPRSSIPSQYYNSSADINGPIPVWSWDGLLHCLSEGCLTPVDDGHEHHHDHHHHHSSATQLDLGIPCKDAQELLSIAQSFTHAWIPAPHGAPAQLDSIIQAAAHQYPANSYYTIPYGGLASRHWKVRFDSVDRDPSDPSLTRIKASLVDFSPSQTVVSSWQGGPASDTAPAQFVLKGPLFTSTTSSSLNRTCYYSVALEKPDSRVLQPFAKALINDSSNNLLNVGPSTPNNMPTTPTTNLNVAPSTPNNTPTTPTTNLLKPRGPHKPKRNPSTTINGGLYTQQLTPPSTAINGGLYTQQLTPQNCLSHVPWADIMAAALCYAYNFVGTSTLGPCSTFSSTDISLIANCFQSFITNNLD